MIKLPVKTTKTFTATSYWTFGDGLEPNEVLIKTKWTRAPNPEMINLPFYFTHDELWKSWTHEIHQPFPQKPQTPRLTQHTPICKSLDTQKNQHLLLLDGALCNAIYLENQERLGMCL